MTTPIPTIEWTGNHAGCLKLLDQTRLPGEVTTLTCHTREDVWQAIRQLSVRGAPAIGVTAAYGVVLGSQVPAAESVSALQEQVRTTCEYLATSRPTAVNLFWALERMRQVAEQFPGDAEGRDLAALLLSEACQIHQEDRQQCAAIGRHGAELLAGLPFRAGILTHCNAGALATGGDGTALAVIFAMATAGAAPQVFVDETRPLLQGARLTAWELSQRNIMATLICDSMAAQVMREGRVQAVITGADRIAANGDTANKIGTYGLAVLARAHDIPFYVAAPTTTFDMSLADGSSIPIEERSPEEITHSFGAVTAPENVSVYNPAFDISPAELIAAIITEWGVIQPVSADTIASTLEH